MEEIIIEKKENEILVCVLEKGEIVEKYEFDPEETATIGNIYCGTAEEILDGMQACFVDIGLSKKAFLSLKDAMPKVNMVAQETKVSEKLMPKREEIKISEVLQKGQKVLVQIRKEAFEEKGPRVSTHITLAGNYLVLMPNTDIFTISQKIESHTAMKNLIERLKKELPDGFGLIVRTDAVGVSDEKILQDLKQLLQRWEKIQEEFQEIQHREKQDFVEPKDRLLYNDNLVIPKVARDMVRQETKKIYVNDKEIATELEALVNPEIIEFQEKKDFLMEFGLLSELERIDSRKIWLKCGAQIVIDRAEALTAIDVNSNHCVGKQTLEETVFKVNQEAAIEIMKQIRLKDIGGIIIIDFIDMETPAYKKAILDLMREEQKKDRSKVDIKDFTQLNLVEMTRKKMYV